MESDSDPARNHHNGTFHAGNTKFSPPIFQHAGSFHYSVAALPAYFLPVPTYPIYPGAAVEQLMPGGFRAIFATGAPKHGSLDEGFEAAARQVNNLQPSADPGFAVLFTPRIETPMLHATDTHQNWQYWTAGRHTTQNDFDFSQAGTVAPTALLSPSLHPSAGYQDWQYETAARDNANEFDFQSQATSDHSTLLNDARQDSTINLVTSDRINENIHSAGKSSFDTDHSLASPYTATHLPFNNSYQPTNTTYATLTSLEELTPQPTLDPDTSFSSTSSSPLDQWPSTPSPTNASSPSSARHPCQHCTKDFTRLGDLTRHVKTHFPERHREHSCWQPDCDRNGRKAFTRRDKLLEHLRRVHKLEEDEFGI